ncbi:glycosyltransferase family 39 protein [Kitasatospora acidiphila]|uniref:Glycosyltransferase family 39 protein n=1 Tax=Kitasatospora acidiphila TaxID=2567942 RepID=A0A540W0L3_9ACTN|nr:glycosyltransferase family 39 protein [Kitasatospora acidiphila]TQF02531.1 glycosyltransferase family 39 protein [Kitasatospora acidiphila]
MTYHAETTAVADPGPRPAPPTAAARRGGGRSRWEVWRSPEEQPWWARPVLLAIAAFAAALYSWNIATAGYALFYSNSVRSMSVSWKAWLFGAMDPGATITLDKIPGAFAVQALFVRVFGFHQWSVTLPQVIEGVIAVLVLYRVVRRWSGPVAGLIASALFTLTPVVASMFGHSMEDGALTCCLVLAADRFQVAVMRGRLRSLIWAGVWVGVGFQMKMMQAWLVLPAFALAYLLVAPGRLRRRVWHTAVAGVVCLAVSVTWVAMMELVPAKDRPYVDGSTNNSAVAMVFGYNGLDRFGIHISGAVENMFSGGAPKGQLSGGTGGGAGAPGAVGAPGVEGGAGAPGFGGGGAAGAPNSGAASGDSGNGPAAGLGGGPGGFPGRSSGGEGTFGGPQGGRPVSDGSPWLKLFQGRFAPQISWLLPFALLMIVLGLYRGRGKERTDVLRGGFVTWGAWLLVVGLVFSDMSTIPHTAYMATLAPAIAALCGAGMVLLWRTYREGGRASWLLPSVVAAQAAWTWYLWSGSTSFAPWLRWAGLVAALVGTAALVLGRLSGRGRARVAAVGAVLGLATTAVGSAAWASSGFDAKFDGSAFDAGAGPQGSSIMGMPQTGLRALKGGEGLDGQGLDGAGRSGGRSGLGGPSGPGAPGGMDPSDKLTGDELTLWNYVKAHQDSAEYPLATIGWSAAQPYILSTGAKVLPIGGFSGQIPQPTLSAFTALVQQGRVHFLLTGGGGMGMMGRSGSGSASDTSSDQITAWAKAHCSEVPSTDYGVSQAAGASRAGGPFGGADGAGTLYRCDSGA